MARLLSVPSRVFQTDLFRELPAAIARDFAAAQNRLFYTADTELFSADQQAFAIFVVHSGSVSILPSGGEGTMATPTTAFADEVLGLSATMSGEPYQFTARTAEFSEIGMVSRADLLEFLATHSEFAFAVVRSLSDHLTDALDHLRALPPVVQA
jgi:CRP-like cAMP-binding protein